MQLLSHTRGRVRQGAFNPVDELPAHCIENCTCLGIVWNGFEYPCERCCMGSSAQPARSRLECTQVGEEKSFPQLTISGICACMQSFHQDVTTFDATAMSVQVHPTSLELPTFASLRSSSMPIEDEPTTPIVSLISNNDGECQDTESLARKPLLQPARTIENRVSRNQTKKWQSWRVGIALAAFGTCTILLTNLSLLVVAVALSSYTTELIGTLYHGSCKTAGAFSTCLHLLINILSSILLGASNYTMQCLAAPTRDEIDRAHSKSTWLDIGVPSVRNILGGVSKRRSAMWILLCLSSFPIHFVYNSAIFKSTNANLYRVALVTEHFLQGMPFAADMDKWNQTLNADIDPEYQFDVTAFYPEVRRMQAVFGQTFDPMDHSIENLTALECIRQYSREIVSRRTDLLLITPAQHQAQNKSFIDYDGLAGGFPPQDWFCSYPSFRVRTRCFFYLSMPETSSWRIGAYPISYCLSLKVQEHCEVQFSIPILIAVICCNAIKASVMIWTSFRQRETTFVTVGDAIANYLDNTDDYTAQQCFLDKWTATKGRSQSLHGTLASGQTISLQRHFWFTTTSSWLWWTTLVLSSSLLGPCIWFLLSPPKWAGSIAMSFGAIESDTTMDVHGQGAKGIFLAILLANFPHVICSILYFVYNGLFTAMLSSSEWNRYYLRPKPLRTSTPRGKQRSKYYLQLPYKVGVPLLVASMLLHWLISESIFLARVEMRDPDGNLWDNPGQEVGQVAISRLPMLIFIILGFLLVLFALGIGLRKFKTHMPVAASCSLAISAACHRPPEDVDAAYLPVNWGEVKRMGTEDLGHCCCTSEEVCAIEPGRLYAGREDD